MKNSCVKLIPFLIPFALLLFSTPKAEASLAVDKAAHFGIAATAQTACSGFAQIITSSKWGSKIACFLLINTAGAAKEITDPYTGGSRDSRDIYANLAGSGLSFFVLSVGF